MKTIKQDYKARAAVFENEDWWKKYLKDNLDSFDDSNDPDMEKMKNITERNLYLIKYFADDLAKQKKLSDKTIQKHVNNIDFYLNYYVVWYNAVPAEEAMDESMLDDFMMDWFPRKAMWCSVNSIKDNCASFKKFYTWMFENDLVSKEELFDLNQCIKDNKEYWIESYQQREAYYEKESAELFGIEDD